MYQVVKRSFYGTYTAELKVLMIGGSSLKRCAFGLREKAVIKYSIWGNTDPGGIREASCDGPSPFVASRWHGVELLIKNSTRWGLG